MDSKDIIPKKLQNWNLNTINELIKFRDAESENLDFKQEIKDITKDICAFANTTGGFLVFGIGAIKNSSDKTVLGYKKIGFKKGLEDEMGLEISNSCFLISPIPAYEVKHIQDDSVFYSVVQIQNEISKKPFFLKNKGQCFVRIDSSARPAPRSTIMNLFGASIEYHKNIQNLQSSCVMLKEALSHTLNYIERISAECQTRPAPIDLTTLRYALLPTIDFLTENDLLGHKTKSTITEGITTVINTIEQLNAQLYVYNTTDNIKTKKDVQNMIRSGRNIFANDLNQISEILDKIISKTEEYLLNSK